MSTSSFDPARTSKTLLIGIRDSQDQQAWEEFHARYSPMIRGWCLQWFPREPDDMVQEVLVLLAKRCRRSSMSPPRDASGASSRP